MGRPRANISSVRTPALRGWRHALGMPLWFLEEISDVCAYTICKAERGAAVSRATARLLSIALGIPLDLLLHVGPDHEKARAVVSERAPQVQQELATHLAARIAKRMSARVPTPVQTAKRKSVAQSLSEAA